MKISDIERGNATTIEIRPVNEEGFGRFIPALSEANLSYSELTDEMILGVGDDTWHIAGLNSRHQECLDRVALNNLPRVAWAAAALPNGSKHPKSMVIEVREFPSEQVWPEAVDFGVDEKIVDALRKKRKSLVSINDVILWLEDKVLVKSSGDNNLIFLSGSPMPQAEKRSGFRLYGKGIAVDIARDTDDRLVVTRVVEARRPIFNDERRPMVMVRGQIRFVDYTIAGHFRGTARTQLDQLVQDSDSYLSLWRVYNQIERQDIYNRARDFGWLRYSIRRQLTDGSWRFTLSDSESLESNIRVLEDSEAIDLEAAERPPIELIETNGASS